MTRFEFVIAHIMQEYKVQDPNIAFSMYLKQSSEYINIYRKIFGKHEEMQVSVLFFFRLIMLLECNAEFEFWGHT